MYLRNQGDLNFIVTLDAAEFYNANGVVYAPGLNTLPPHAQGRSCNARGLGIGPIY